MMPQRDERSSGEWVRLSVRHACRRCQPTCLAALLVILTGASAVPAQDVPDQTPGVNLGTTSADAPDEGESPSHPKRQRVVAGLMVLFGIVCLGLLLLGLIVLAGHRIRQIARSPLPPRSRFDEFWYLRARRKHARPPRSDHSTPEPDEQGPGAG